MKKLFLTLISFGFANIGFATDSGYVQRVFSKVETVTAYSDGGAGGTFINLSGLESTRGQGHVDTTLRLGFRTAELREACVKAIYMTYAASRVGMRDSLVLEVFEKKDVEPTHFLVRSCTVSSKP